MIRHRFYSRARKLLLEPCDHPPSPELSVEIELTAAGAEVGLGNEKEAAGRLDALLARLTHDYWRRAEILRRRIALVKSEAERNSMTKAARDRVAANTRDETAVLDLAQLLDGFGFRRDALNALLEGARSLPSSARIEKEILELFDRVRDERSRETYLAERVKAFPDRPDLAILHVKSLFLLNRRKEAMAELESVAKNLDPREKVRLLTDTARFLRRSSLISDASAIFRKVIEAAPEMVGVRRELAETLVATGDRQGARELFAAGMPGEAETEELLDAVQFMLKLELFLEARIALKQAMERDATNMELRMLLLNIESRLGSRAEGENLILKTRSLADTPARYRLWLESAVAFHEGFETADAFLLEEKVRIVEEDGAWTKKRMDRFLAFVDVASKNGFKSEVAVLLEDYLGTELPAAVRGKLRRRLITLLQGDPTQVAAVECTARLLVMYGKAENYQRISELLDKVDLKKLSDPTLLSALEKIYAGRGKHEHVLQILGRLTALDPTNRGNWERWITATAETHDEIRLRSGIRKLLVGIDQMPLSDDTRSLLQSHLVDSYWRSIAEHLWNPDETSLVEAATLLDTVERSVQGHEEWLWVTWARAYVLGRQGRTKARDEAVGELERVVREVAAREGGEKTEATDGAEEIFVFPDGLAVSIQHARRLLTGKREEVPSPPLGDRLGPLPKLRVAWAFDTNMGASVTGIVRLDDTRILVSDVMGTLYCLDESTGKLLWDLPGAVTAAITSA
jgi:thioredoxin-like negative regulator of GroEL